jgi:prostaglandin-E synthase 1
MTAARRSGVKKYLNPEDHKVAFVGATQVDGAEHPDVARVQRAHRNLLESLPLFFALGLIYVLCGASPLGAKICFPLFAGARVLHSIVYIKGLQPWRTMSFFLGTFSLLGTAALILLRLFG